MWAHSLELRAKWKVTQTHTHTHTHTPCCKVRRDNVPYSDVVHTASAVHTSPGRSAPPQCMADQSLKHIQTTTNFSFSTRASSASLCHHQHDICHCTSAPSASPARLNSLQQCSASQVSMCTQMWWTMKRTGFDCTYHGTFNIVISNNWAVLTGQTGWVCHIGTLTLCIEVVA